MKSGDISVFWQEIIDAYRDIMIVKNSERAKVYLDLTDAEYASLSSIAAQYTMARLSYHTSMLEGAMADMQRAINSKRAIAEITLTRMCDSRLSSSNESLLLRLEELEKTVKMMKLGVPNQSSSAPSAEPTAQKNIEKPISKQEKTESEFKEDVKSAPKKSGALSLYAGWGSALRKISELKRSLSAGFVGASVYTDGDNTFVIRMTGFFSNKLKSSETDMAIVRGVIAENEGKNAAEINLVVEDISAKENNQASLANPV